MNEMPVSRERFRRGIWRLVFPSIASGDVLELSTRIISGWYRQTRYIIIDTRNVR